ncbi:MAG: hypothetical protein HOD90_01615 [Nitrospina sp.]|nr:hypothetical protein [Nitrospina sp.]
MGNLEDKEIIKAENLIKKILEEAEEISEMGKSPDKANRLRLYAKVAGWVKEHEISTNEIRNCPVCQSDIEEKKDEVTGEKITTHISHFLEQESGYLEKGFDLWANNSAQLLRSDIHNDLSAEINQDLPSKPIFLIEKTFTEEIFNSEPFANSLTPLKQSIISLFSTYSIHTPIFYEPDIVSIPKCFGGNDGKLATSIKRTKRAIAFSRWRKNNAKFCTEIFFKIVGRKKEEPPKGTKDIETWPLLDRLIALEQMVQNTSPITDSKKLIREMKSCRTDRNKQLDRISHYKSAAEAIGELFELNSLVEIQVGSITRKLLQSTLKIKDDLYSAAFSGTPKVISTDVTPKGGMVIEAESNGTKTSASHISNASDLRATLLGFLIAFHKHLLETQGGLSLLLLDDPQELFDCENRKKVAKTIPSLAAKGAKIIVTTNDQDFARQVVSTPSDLSSSEIDHLAIHPLTSTRSHIELGIFESAVNEKRRLFEQPENENKHQPARDYVKDLRIYIENRLKDFFDTHDPGLPEKPGLSDLVGAVRSRVNNQHSGFTSKVFNKFVSDPALKSKSAFLELLNQSHHGDEDQITYDDVLKRMDDCKRVSEIIENTHEEYERWLRRVPEGPFKDKPEIPSPIEFPIFEVPVFENLAAFSSEQSIGITHETDDNFSSNWFNSFCIYNINSQNLGFSGTKYNKVVVSLSEEIVPDQALVIALWNDKVWARRLLTSNLNKQFIVLSSEAENPKNRPPTLLVHKEEVRLLKVMGILFDDQPVFPKPTEEALLVSDSSYLKKIKVIFQVRGASALPLALEGQKILGGEILLPNQLKSNEGSIVAISTSKGDFLKRVGEPIPEAPHIRQFESIGGRGDSVLVCTEEIDDKFSALPQLNSARHVLGVLYS